MGIFSLGVQYTTPTPEAYVFHGIRSFPCPSFRHPNFVSLGGGRVRKKSSSKRKKSSTPRESRRLGILFQGNPIWSIFAKRFPFESGKKRGEPLHVNFQVHPVESTRLPFPPPRLIPVAIRCPSRCMNTDQQQRNLRNIYISSHSYGSSTTNSERRTIGSRMDRDRLAVRNL